MQVLFHLLWPELLLVAAACVLFLMGAMPSAAARRAVPLIALAALAVVFFATLIHATAASASGDGSGDVLDPTGTILVGHFAIYIKTLATGVAMLFVFLCWPTDFQATSNSALDVGTETGEFFGLLLLSITGILLVADANDLILLFLGIELASIPTYIMVSISRPLPIAQEAGVKYFFLGAMAAAVMLFGFSYLYGTTGTTDLAQMRSLMHPGVGAGADSGPSTWQLLAVVLAILGIAFKLAAVPLHAYAGDVYQGAATPVTALLAFVPKTSGMVALIKILAVAAGPDWRAPDALIDLLWVLAVLTMTFGNVLALLQMNVKRVMAYSSVAHSGYMLTGLTALLAAKVLPTTGAMTVAGDVQQSALGGVLFYLAAYGIMNTGTFGVLMLLAGHTDAHARHDATGRPLPTAGSAETFEDLSGQGRRYVALGLAMSICCFSLIGMPLTVGFFGKVLLIKPALSIAFAPGGNAYSRLMVWLAVITMVNAAISAIYYLKIIAYLFLRSEGVEHAGGHHHHAGAHHLVPSKHPPAFRSLPATIAIVLSVAGTLYYGIYFPGTQHLTDRASGAAKPVAANAVQSPVPASAPPAVARAGGR